MLSLFHELAEVIRHTEDSLLSGDSRLSLITPVLSRFTSDLLQIPSQPPPRRAYNEPSLSRRPVDRMKAEAFQKDLQYVGYIADRIQSLLILHGDSTLQGAISLQPFRSLKILELRRLPLHLLKGLANLRGQLECVICVRSVQNLELLLVKCGGDASHGFQWPLLHTLACNNCDIEELGTALNFVGSLRNLDLSRNWIRSCKNAFESLEELVIVNLNYNFIEKIPQFSPMSRHRLRILTLRNNRLESIDGIEEMEALQELDLSENCLIHHDVLWPLRRLGRLIRLFLSGNPMFYHEKHRLLTVINLSTQVAKHRHFTLDGLKLSRAEAAYIPEGLGGAEPRSASPNEAVLVSVESGSQGFEPSSGDADIMSVGSVSGRKKQIRTRVVDVGAMGDGETQRDGLFVSNSQNILSSSTSSAFASDIEDLRQRHGEDWIKFHAHLEPVAHSMPIAIEKLDFDSVMNDVEESAVSAEEEITVLRTESVLDPEPLHTESNEKESEPFLVQLQDKPDPDDALLVSLGDLHLIERNILGVIVEMLEKETIQKCESGVDPSEVHIYFDYMRKDRRSRKYVFEDAERAGEFLLLVAPLLEGKEKVFKKFQCLQCSQIFPEYRAETKIRCQPLSEAQSGYSTSIGSASASNKGVMAEALICPYCGSEMLVEHKTDSDSPSPETGRASPVPGASSDHVPVPETKKRNRSSSVTVLVNEPTDDEETILPGSYRGSQFSPEMMSPPNSHSSASFRTPDLERADSSEETLFTVHGVDEAVEILRENESDLEVDGFKWRFDDFRSVDHRLRLHIDMEVLKDADEQFEMIAKAGFLNMKSSSSFDATVVISNKNIIICQPNEDLGQDSATRMTVEETVPLKNINLVHQVSDQESLRLGLTDGAFWLLLFRDRSRTIAFSHQFEEVLATGKVAFYLRETSDVSALESWLANTPFEGDETDLSLKITLRTLCYMGKSPVTILCTETHLIITMDDYQQLLRGGSSAVTLVDSKPISAISGLVASRSTPRNIGVKFFNDDPDCIQQWDLRFETVDGLNSLVQALRLPWENLVFHVPLNVEVHP